MNYYAIKPKEDFKIKDLLLKAELKVLIEQATKENDQNFFLESTIKKVLVHEDKGNVVWEIELGCDVTLKKQDFLLLVQGKLAEKYKLKRIFLKNIQISKAKEGAVVEAKGSLNASLDFNQNLFLNLPLLWEAILQNIECSEIVKNILRTARLEKREERFKVTVVGKLAEERLKKEDIRNKIEQFLYHRTKKVHIVSIFLAEEDDEIIQKQEEEILSQLQTKEYLNALENIQDKGQDTEKKVALFGSMIKALPKNIRTLNSITEEDKNIVVCGKVVKVDGRELKTGRLLFTFELADETDGIVCKRFFEKEDDESFRFLVKNLKKGLLVKVKGTVQHDRFADGELVLFFNHINREEIVKREDKALEKRVELHLHTQMSAMDAVSSVESMIETAATWGHQAIAITDHGVVQSFPMADEFVSSRKIPLKIIYGVEGYLVEKDLKRAYHIILLAKNAVGLKNLYRLITLSHLEYFYRTPRLPREEIIKNREGLIIGSACEAGELMQAVLQNKDEETLEKIAGFYDYLEIQPKANNEFLVRRGIVKNNQALEDVNKKIVSLGKKLQKLVVATGDVHFLNPEDEIFRRIIMSGKKMGDAEEPLPLYLRTTEEMLEEFSYLGNETAFEVVVKNTQLIAEQVESLKPIPTTQHPPKMEGAENEVREMSVKKAMELYGNPLPLKVEERLKYELHSIIDNNFSVLYLIAERLVKKSLSDGYLVGSRGSVGSSFVATLMGITEVNPLPPHWRCSKCLQTIFVDDGSVGSGFDLNDRECEFCKEKMQKDGHDIPFAVFMGFKGEKTPDIDLNFSGDYQAIAHQYTEELLGKGNVFRAGTIATVADKTAFGFAKKYAEEQGIKARTPYINSLVAGCAGVKRTTGQHPGGVMVVPHDMDVHYFTPLQRPADAKKPEIKKDKRGMLKNEAKMDVITTHFDYHSISERLVKLDILGHDAPTIIRMLEEMTGIKATEIDFANKETMSLFFDTKAINLTKEELGDEVATLGIPEFGTGFVRQMLRETRPKCFSELVRISGFSHGTDVWLGNAQDLIKEGTAKLSEAISARDDIMIYLIYKGLEPEKAFKIMEGVRKGKGVSPENVKLMRDNKVPEWYILSCQKIKYMFPKAHAVAYVMMAFRIAYCKVKHPLAFYASYFTTKAMIFDAEKIVKGKDFLLREMAKMSKGEMSATDEKLFAVMEVAREMYLRGFAFKKVSVQESLATKFKIINAKELLPPLVSLAGLGEEVAQNIVLERSKSPFTSVEDVKARGKVNKTLVELMQKHGSFEGLAESDQISLFEL